MASFPSCGAHHISCIRENPEDWVEQILEKEDDCPLCPKSKKGPSSYGQLNKHLQLVHLKRGVLASGCLVVPCYLECRSDRRGHFHCPCGQILSKRQRMLLHVEAATHFKNSGAEAEQKPASKRDVTLHTVHSTSPRKMQMEDRGEGSPSCSRKPVSMVMVIQGLEDLRIALPLSLLELLPQLGASHTMECAATHNFDNEVLIKMHKTEDQLLLDLHSKASGQSLLADRGEGWHCFINKIKGDVFHHLPDPPENQGSNSLLAEVSPVENYVPPLPDEPEPGFLETTDVVPVIDPNSFVAEDTANAAMTQVVESSATMDIIVEAAAAANAVDDALVYANDDIAYVSVTEDGADVMMPSTVELDDNLERAADSSQQNALLHAEESDLMNVADDYEANRIPQKLPRIVQDILAYKCYVCNNRFTKLDTLAGHLKKKHGVDIDEQQVETVVMKNAHFCFICQAIAPNYDAIRKHLQRVHNTGDQLRSNRKAGTPGTEGLRCSICRKLYVSVHCLGMHVRGRHKNHPSYPSALRYVQEIRDNQSKRQKSKVFSRCIVCSEQFCGARIFRHMKESHKSLSNFDELLKQMRKVFSDESKKVWNFDWEHQLENVECPKCLTKMQRKNLARHKAICRGKPKIKEEDQPTKVQCPECGKDILESYLPRHRKDRCSVKTEKPWNCQQCGETFPNRYELNKHARNFHSGLPPVPPKEPLPDYGVKRTGKGGARFCEYCQMEMSLSWVDMRTHRRQVHGVVYTDDMENAVLECSVCHEQVPGGPMKLQLHKKKQHSKCIIFCDICNKEMFNGGPNSLKTHLRSVHELPVDMTLFQCGYCSKQFIRKSSLIWHLQNVHGDRDQNCPHCSKVFKSRIALKNHVTKVHMKIYSFLCSKCGKGFNKKVGLTAHVAKCIGVSESETIASESSEESAETQLVSVKDEQVVDIVVKETQQKAILQSASSVIWPELKEESLQVWETLSDGSLLLRKKMASEETGPGEGDPEGIATSTAVQEHDTCGEVVSEQQQTALVARDCRIENLGGIKIISAAALKSPEQESVECLEGTVSKDINITVKKILKTDSETARVAADSRIGKLGSIKVTSATAVESKKQETGEGLQGTILKDCNITVQRTQHTDSETASCSNLGIRVVRSSPRRLTPPPKRLMEFQQKTMTMISTQASNHNEETAEQVPESGHVVLAESLGKSKPTRQIFIRRVKRRKCL